MNIIGLLRTLERVTRPPTRPTFSDTDDPLTDEMREAETECLVPEDFKAVCRCVACVAEERAAGDELAADDEAQPQPWKVLIDGAHGCRITLEDSLCGDGVWLYSRTAVEINRAIFLPEEAVRELRDQLFIRCAMAKSSASNHAGTDTEPAPSPTIVQSAPPPTVDGGAGGGGVLHSPGARLPHPQNGCDGKCARDECVCPDDAAAEWIGWAVPAICTVLHDHRPFRSHPIANEDDGWVYCSDDAGKIHRRIDDYQAWLEHVSPLIALALQQK